MEIQPECVPCLMKRVLFQAELAGNGSEFRATKAALDTYANEFDKGRNSAEIATAVHRSAYRAMGVRDPYVDLKIKSDEVASKYVPIVRDRVSTSSNPFGTAVLYSIIGNVMDFGSGISIDRPEDIDNRFSEFEDQGISSEDANRLLEIIKKGGTVIYLFDNCGEALFDIILIDEIRKTGARVVGVVRGEPILNDITEEDADRIDLKDHVDRLLTTSQFAIGLDLKMAGGELIDELSSAGLVIAKGMANFESLSDRAVGTTIAYLLRSKCAPVARALGVKKDTNVIKIVESGST